MVTYSKTKFNIVRELWSTKMTINGYNTITSDKGIKTDKELFHLVLRQEGVAVLGDSADGHINRVCIGSVHVLGNKQDATAV